AYMALVLNQLGILGNKPEAETQQILGQFIVAATQTNVETDLRAGLNALAQQYGVSEFKLTGPRASTIYTQILTGATIPVTNGQPLVIQGKEQRLDANLAFSLAHDTKEYVALMSLFYNAESLVAAGSKLATAVINGKRADAWYEIRYQSNRGGLHTGRRIDESNLFGLYDSPELGVQEAEAKDVLRMYTAHREQIQAYEARHVEHFTVGGTTSIQFQLIGAKTPLINTYRQGQTIDGDVLVGQDDPNGSDGLIGTASNDLIFGEQGNDVIVGRPGGDVLYGGEGYDQYLFTAGDGQDIVLDADGQGILIGTTGPILAGLQREGTTPDTWQGGNSETFRRSGNDLRIELQGQDTITVKDYFAVSGTTPLGIRLVSEGSYANGFPEFTDIRGDGDDVVALFGATNYTVHGNGGNDFIRTAQGNDQLFGGAGMDEVYGFSGHDRLDGGTENDFLHGDNDDASVLDGDDYLEGNAGNDELVGGWGDDLLFGGDGADTLWGDSLFKAQESFSADDYLDGGAGDDELHGLAGNDVLYGGADNDFLSGEEGNDLLDGGTGDDLLLAFTGQVDGSD
ncbi:MAG: calcium-binding protein, partial [Nitrospirales bacterium]